MTRFSVNDSQLDFDWYEGSGLYGIGYDPVLEEIYLANAKGFQGNGEVEILNKAGEVVKRLDAGRAPSGFYFH